MIQQYRPAVLYLMLWAGVLNIFFMSKVNNFWVVTKPSKKSELIDILFHADMKRMQLQFNGGLTSKEIIGIFTTKTEAEKVAKRALLKAGAINKF